MKSKILLLTTMLASAGFAFAQQTVNRSGITYQILEGSNNVQIEEDGDLVEEKPVSITYSANDGILIQDETYQYISNQKRRVNVKAIAINDASKVKPGQILSWESAAPRPQTTIIENFETSLSDFGTSPQQNGTLEYNITKNEKYYIYEKVCQRARKAEKFSDKIFKGKEDENSEFPSVTAEFDERGVAIHPDLYYYKDFKIQEMNFGGVTYRVQIDVFRLIENTNGGIYLKQELTNCYDVYTPSEIANDIAWNVTTSGKIGMVTGIVNNKRIAEAVARGERNFDFTGATILGEVNVDVPANKLAYFTKTTTAAGTNVVYGALSDKYLIKDNGEEIYVSKAFTADEAIYERNFNAGSYATLVLPFKAENTGEIFERQAKLDGYDATANKISCIMTETLAANVPYLIQISSDATEINEINASIQKTGSPKSSVYNGLQLVGTYAPIAGTALTNNYIFSTTGVIGRLKASSTLKPGRCYFNYTPASSSSAKIDNATIEIRDEEGSIIDFIAPNFDEEATDIDGVVENSKVVSVQYISVNGQVSNEPVKGMNLVKKTYANGTVETSKVTY